ncbi:hypothetical protein LSH36_771g00024 [Paralvinella palmiformis]|uniref:Nucleotide-diphospho-sugar transferase domain-containing protein n=1 Tax=Paralvinella palmiformis TaxID=53620 RepID=A0AAD9J0F3_9ANNE|nr:hypothetical protein LSH36_771g00024 [Paralvinella palmiformis]
MLLLRAMPKHLGLMIGVGVLVPCLVVVFVMMYTSNYMDEQGSGDGMEMLFGDHSARDEERPIRKSYAYQKQLEQEQIDLEERVNVDVDENVRDFEKLDYREALKKTADHRRVVMVKFCEAGRVDGAINFHETSVAGNEIDNILYVTTDIRVCAELWKLEIKCHVMEEDFMTFNNSQVIETERSVGKKVAIARIKLILKAITSGYTILFTDLKTLYMKNPFEHIDCADDCDVALSVDNISLNFANWAIHLAKPRRSTVYMYARLLTIMGTMSVVSTKDVLNQVVGEMTALSRIRVEYLSAEKFSPASFYFLVRRFQDEENRCRSCVAVFEDRGLSRADQIYQLKEVHLWNANFDEYYTSRRRSYILYENVWRYGERRSIVEELTALRNALAIGQVLGRIVILPKFHCPHSIFENKFCGLCDLIKMANFDDQFGDMYRENTFLDHPKVSREVRRSKTDYHYIGKKLPTDVDWDPDCKIKPRHNIIFLTPKHPRGLKSEELEAIFKGESSYSLRFHSLYEGFAGFDDERTKADFNRKIKRGFVVTSPIRELIDDKTFEIL